MNCILSNNFNIYLSININIEDEQYQHLQPPVYASPAGLGFIAKLSFGF